MTENAYREQIARLERENSELGAQIEGLTVEIQLWRKLESTRVQAAQLEGENSELRTELAKLKDTEEPGEGN